ncbi:ferritin-like domain-containing protein [Pelobacter seleniigenes]|uniref:ferritin-like domain-containing protein n=1 Tax=Pelobacter seleniigenes TaxID=407188 RepID=UPI0004A70A47|nr:ferritin family protein [Pelobacter seleniigenes]
MKILDFAMQMEEDGKSYYQQLANQAKHPGLKNIFQRLVLDEQKHYEIFQRWKLTGKAPHMTDTTIIADVKNVFEQLPQTAATLEVQQGDLDAYQHAMKIEADSFRLYEECAEKEADEGTKALLLRIAAEEHKHFNVMENIYHFINAPNQYLAWGEFSNLDEFRQFGRDVDI